MNQEITKLGKTITPEFINEIRTRHKNNLRIRRTLPANGRLHIDRNQPFLYVYRRPYSGSDHGTDQLIKGEASYLVTSAAPRYKAEISNLVQTIAESSASISGAFLLVEIWSSKSPISIINPDSGRTAPSFRIMVPSNRIPVETIESMELALKRISVSKKRAEVSTHFLKRTWPDKLSPLLKPADIYQNNCYLIGIEVSPIYRDPETGEIYPLVLKKIHRGLSQALKIGAYEFSQKRTSIQPKSYKSLGRRAVVKAVWEVDRELAQISNEIDFLLLISPVNIEQSWLKFKAGKFLKSPTFFYRPVSFDPSVLKRKLYSIPFDRIEDPTLSSIFHKKLVELELKFSMIRDRNTRNFFFGSMQLYGELDSELLGLAEMILEKISPHSREIDGKRKFNAHSFAERAQIEIARYRKVFPEIRSKVYIRDDITGLMVSNGNLLVGKRVQIPESRVEALIQHEVGTHVLTYVNGTSQPFQQLYCGLAGSDELQEGLAVLSEYLVGGLSPPRFRLLAGRVVAAQMLINDASFMETFRELHYKYEFAQRTAYVITSRIFRSGGFTKDAIYLRGLVNLVDHLRKGGKLEPLLIGKISINDVPFISELQLRKVLKPVLLTPEYLRNSASITSLDNLKQGQQIFNLI